MQEYLGEIAKLEKIAAALYDAYTIAADCDDEESANLYAEAGAIADRMRTHRIERIKKLPDSAAADLLYWVYVDEQTPKHIRKCNKWNTGEYYSRLKKAQAAYKETLIV